MPQDETFAQRKDRIKQTLRPYFDDALDGAATTLAQARDGVLIEDTEKPLYDRINQLRRDAQEAGLQERVDEVQADFFPSGPPTSPAQ